MAVLITRGDEELLIAVSGLFGMEEVRKCVNALRTTNAATSVLRFDLRECTEIGAPAIGAMLHLQSRYGPLGRPGIIQGGSGTVSSLLKLCDLERWFVIEQGVEHATASGSCRGRNRATMN